MEKQMQKQSNTDSPLIVYCYRQLSDIPVFRDLLETRFRETGHTRKIEFRLWDCYKQSPGDDGDIYIYDGMVLSALAEMGYIQQLHNNIDTSGVFEWILDGSRVKKQIFGIPFMACVNVLIFRKGEEIPFEHLAPGQIAAPMKSMIGEYYLFSYFNSPHKEEGSLETLKRLRNLIGGGDAYDYSRFSEYDGIDRFMRGDCKCLLGFTEDLRALSPGDYTVIRANISDSIFTELPFNFVNYISVGSCVTEERLQDCLDLIEIVSDRQFFMEYCTKDGELRYYLPADETLYAGLISLDEVYVQLYEIMRDENNCILRYGKNFYEEFPKKSEELHNLLGSHSKEESQKLAEPTEEYEQEIRAYRDAFLESGDSMDGTGGLRKYDEPKDWITFCKNGKDPCTVPEGLVPATQYMLVREEDHKIIGMIQIRHYFNSYLEKFGGHIGYSVAPDERRKGYAEMMLRMALPECRKLGIGKVLITCIKGNEASRRTILKNGGVYESTVHEPESATDLERYWIDLHADEENPDRKECDYD